jgi:hypothetical protein
MSESLQPDYQRPIPLRAVRDLIAAARTERAACSVHSPEHEFYLGVEAAAQEVLRAGSTRSRDQLDREPDAFREGYLKTSNLLATALSASEAPLRLSLPDARDAS